MKWEHIVLIFTVVELWLFFALVITAMVAHYTHRTYVEHYALQTALISVLAWVTITGTYVTIWAINGIIQGQIL